jgi:hypothetical protein
MNARSRRILKMTAASLALALAAGACFIPGVGEATLPDDGPPVPVTQAAAESFSQKVLAGAQGDGTFQFTITQQEATSAVAILAELAEFSGDSPILEGAGQIPDQIPLEELPGDLEVTPAIEALLERLQGADGQGPDLSGLRMELDQPEIYFKGDGRMILRGYGVLGSWRLPLRVVTQPRASQGEIVLDFVEGQIGRLPLPEFLFDPLGKLMAQALLAGREYAEISELTVGPGTLTFRGRVNLENLPQGE